MISRRRLLQAAGVGAGIGAGVLTTAGCADLGERRGSGRSRTGRVIPSSAPRPALYGRDLPSTTWLRPDKAGRLTLTQRESDVEILPGLRTRIWAYDGTLPGPTIEGRRGAPMHVTVRNALPRPTSTHLHGGIVPAESDGGPLDLILPSGFERQALDRSAQLSAQSGGHAGHAMPWTLHENQRVYDYPMVQRAALLWYHDHRMDYTAPQVWRGLAGAFVVRDAVEDAANLPAGDEEFVLTLTDRSFGADGELLYPAKDPDLVRAAGVAQEYMDGVLGDVMLVNGTPTPRIRVPAARIRLRLLNACNARVLRLALGRALPMHQIGTDNGLLHAPVAVRSALELAPAERIDLLLDFSDVARGDTVDLRNDADPELSDIARFIVDRPSRRQAPLPTVLDPDLRPLRESEARVTRAFDFRLRGDMWQINGQSYLPQGSLATIERDQVEKWVFTSDFTHPVHVHLGHFQVLRRNGRVVDPEVRGWKDTVMVDPYGSTEVLIRFSHFSGRYMLHCHNLEHEDMAMMGNIDVIGAGS